MINVNEVEKFLNGFNPLKYVVSIQCNNFSNKADVIIHNPETNEKKIEKIKYTPFIWIKDLKKQNITFYDNDESKKAEAINKYKIKIKKLNIEDKEGTIERLSNGYKYLIYTETGSLNNIINFFKEGGLDINTIRKEYNSQEEKLKSIDNYYNESLNKIIAIERDIKKKKIKFEKYNDEDNEELRKNLIEKLNENKTKGKVTERAFLKIKEEVKNKIIDLNTLLETKKEELIPIQQRKENFEKNIEEIRFKYEFTFQLSANEQFMISTGIRLFKGYENYNEIEKFTFDIETTGLNPKHDRIFLIGCKTNKGFRTILSPSKENDDQAEAEMIRKFFYLYSQKIKPAIIFGYNSENFDWDFILRRAEVLKIFISPNEIQTTFSDEKNYENRNKYRYFIEERKDTLKFGSETEFFIRKNIYGINNIDIWHSVRRAKSINSDIKETGLKYIAKFAGVAKTNRTYVPHDRIYRIWFENKNFIINNENSQYQVIPDEFQDKPNEYLNDFNIKNNTKYELTNGQRIITNYLQDDLDETEAVDNIFNEKNFMLSKNIPTSFTRICTAGDASLWNLLMSCWSFENDIAIPYIPNKRKFVGGLSRTYKLGRSKNILKADFAGLYPSIQIAHDVFPRHDIYGVLKSFLSYFREARNKFKSLAKKETDEKKQRFYDSKQLPLKILNNAMFGSFGSEYFNWSDYDKAEEITCRGRLYLRKMVNFFMSKGFQPVILDTDGVSLSIPDNYEIKFIVEKIEDNISSKSYFNTYIDGMNYIKTIIEKDKNTKWIRKKGDVYMSDNNIIKLYIDESEIEKIFEEFNDDILKNDVVVINEGIMKVDNDGRWESCITVGRKNYANLEFNGKIKLVGNSIKSTTLPDYIEEFLNKGLTMLLKNQGKEFIEYYFNYLADIYNKEIPLKKIATKKTVKLTPQEYINRGKDKNGRDKSRQVHMEHIIKDNLNVDLGSVLYIVNNGSKISDSDSSINKETNKLNSYVISSEELEKNPNKKGDYNVLKYIDAFNTRIESLLICFNQNVAENLLIFKPEDRKYFTDTDCEIKSWSYEDYPYDKEDLDSIEELFTLDNREVEFWNTMVKNPHDIFKDFKTNKDINLRIKFIEKFQEYSCKLKEKGLILKHDIEKTNNDGILLYEEDDQIYLCLKKDNKIEKIKPI